MLRSLAHLTSRFLCWIKRHRLIVPDSGTVKVNLGSGLSVAPSWINIDSSLNALIAGWPRSFHKIGYRISRSRRWYSELEYRSVLNGHDFVHHDVRYGMPFPDRSVHFIYSSRLLEFFSRDEAVRVLKEANRVLVPGGLIRFALLDFEYLVSLCQRGEGSRALGYLNYLFTTRCSGNSGRYLYHTVYDFASLKDLLEGSGFRDVRRFEAGEGETPDLDVLDTRREESLYVEARKK